MDALDGDAMSARCSLAFLHRGETEKELRSELELADDEPIPGTEAAFLEYLFGERYQITLKREGHLRVDFAPPPAEATSIIDVNGELSNQLFHFAKALIQVLQTRKIAAQDFEYKQILTRLSHSPERDLVDELSRNFADGYVEANSMSSVLFAEVSRTLAGRFGSAAYLLQLLLPFRRVDSADRVHEVRRKSFRQWVEVNWHLGVLRNALPDLAEHVQAVASWVGPMQADVKEIESQSERIIGRQASIMTELGVLAALVGLVGAGLSVSLALGLPAWYFTAALAGASGLFFLRLRKSVRTMRDDLDLLAATYRWERPPS